MRHIIPLCGLLTACVPSVVDGDTIDYRGTRYRLIGFDAPELHSHCPREYLMAWRASNYLRRRLAIASDITLDEQPCATHNYGRKCAILRVDGIDIADEMLALDLVAAYDCTSGRCPPKRNWCKNG